MNPVTGADSKEDCERFTKEMQRLFKQDAAIIVAIIAAVLAAALLFGCADTTRLHHHHKPPSKVDYESALIKSLQPH